MRPRFSLRTLLITTSVVCAALAILTPYLTPRDRGYARRSVQITDLSSRTEDEMYEMAASQAQSALHCESYEVRESRFVARLTNQQGDRRKLVIERRNASGVNEVVWSTTAWNTWGIPGVRLRLRGATVDVVAFTSVTPRMLNGEARGTFTQIEFIAVSDALHMPFTPVKANDDCQKVIDEVQRRFSDAAANKGFQEVRWEDVFQ
jgi:hypothetical protein